MKILQIIKVDGKPLEKNLPNQIKNQLKSTNQIKTSPIKNLTER